MGSNPNPSPYDLASGKKAVKPEGKNVAKTPTPSAYGAVPSLSENLQHLADVKVDTMKLKDIKEVILKVRQMHDQVERKLDDLYQMSGWGPREIQNYLDNPNNFASGQWESVQKHREALQQLFKEDPIKGGASTEKGSQSSIVGEKDSKERKGKLFGSRRHWIPMK